MNKQMLPEESREAAGRRWMRAFDVAIEALQAKPDGDLISRRAAILAITGEPPEAHYPSWYADRIKSLPSAETHDKRTETHGVCSDLISRRDVLNMIIVADECEPDLGYTHLHDVIEALPSAESTGAMDEAIQEYIKDGYMQPIGEDLISRQAAIRWVKTECNPYGKPTLDFESGKKVIEHLEQMPSADRLTGTWIFNPKDAIELMFTKPKCSECGFESSDGGNFCSNCGADMRGEEE